MIGAAGGGGGTDWAALGVGRMWAMLESHDDAAHRRLIDGWRRSSELVAQHLTQVRHYREGLARAWPPTGSPAAAAYRERLDSLIANLEETYEAAVANHRAFAGATGALESARAAMAGIRREHAANEVRLAAFAEERRGFELSGGKSGVVVPSPVAQGRQAELEARARSVMSALSTELAQAQAALTVPALYRSPAIAGAGGRDFAVLPAVRMPLPHATPTLSSVPRPASPPTASPPAAAQPSELPPRAPGASPTGTLRPRPAGVSADPLRPSGSAPARRLPAVASVPPRSPAGGSAPEESRPRRSTSLPPGGVIGGGPLRPPASGEAPPRVNPVGGLIGSPQSAVRNPAAVPGPAAVPCPAGRSTESAERAERRRSFEEAWPVPEGVDPIVLPPPDLPVDPGPAIGRR